MHFLRIGLITGILLTLFVGIGNAQQWKNVTLDESEDTLSSFHKAQKQFYKYWEPFQVRQGKYEDQEGRLVKAPGWKQFKRWEWYMYSHTDLMTGKSNRPDVALDRSPYRSNATSNDTYSNWSSLGPSSSESNGAGVGRINTIAFHPTDENTYWVGTPAGGLWKTTDDGQTWEVLTDDLESLGVSNIIIPSDYETSKTIYISTGDRDAADTKSTGVLKSTDGGLSWQQTGLYFNLSSQRSIYHLLLDPADDQHILITASIGPGQTFDGGETWYALGGTDEQLRYLEYKPGSNSVVYGVSDSKFYKSVNGGASWTEKLAMNAYNSRITVSAADPDVIYIVNADDGLDKIYKSTDAGETFFVVMDGAEINPLGWEPDGSDLNEGQGWYDLTIEASPIDADIVFVGGVNTWKSSDGGDTWELSNHWYGGGGAQAVHADKHEIVYRSNGDLFEANDGGLYISTDNVQFENRSTGIVNSQIYKIDVSNNYVLNGLQDNGSKLMVSNGTWYDVNGGDGMQCIIDPSNDEIQYTASQYGNIAKTTDAWVDTYTNISDNIGDGSLKGGWVAPYMLDPNDPNTIYIGYEEIWKSTNGGDSFFQISAFGGNNLVELAISKSNPNFIYAYTYGNFYVTDDGGETWNYGQLPDTDLVTDIEVDFQNPSHIWMTFGDYDAGRVFESYDAGQTWLNISTGLPMVPTLDIEQYETLSGIQLYAGTDLGVYVKNGNDPWEVFSHNLPNVMVTDLKFRYNLENPNESKILIGTYGRGNWISTVYPDFTLPSDITLTSQEVDENLDAGSFVGNFSTAGGDVNDVFDYSFVDGENDNADFSIEGSQLFTGRSFDFETKSSFELDLRTCNADGQCYSKRLEVRINDTNDAPVSIGLSSSTIDENSLAGTVIGSLATDDQDLNDNHTYKFEAGVNDNAFFALNSGEISISTVPNFEVKSAYLLTVKSCDQGGACIIEQIEVSVNNVNEEPTEITLSNAEVLENNLTNEVIGELAVEDEDLDDSHTFELIGLGDNEFIIEGNILKANRRFDFEAQENYEFTIKASDAQGLSYQRLFTISVLNAVNELSFSEELIFEETPVNWSSEKTVEVTNTGENELNLNTSVNDAVFSVVPSSLTLGVGETKSLTLTFSPSQVGSYESFLRLEDGNFNTSVDILGQCSLITGLESSIDGKQFGVYPNPASTELTVDLTDFTNEKPSVMLLSADGNEVYKIVEPKEHLVKIRVDQYQSGIYLVVLKYEGQFLVKKVIIQKP